MSARVFLGLWDGKGLIKCSMDFPKLKMVLISGKDVLQALNQGQSKGIAILRSHLNKSMCKHGSITRPGETCQEIVFLKIY